MKTAYELAMERLNKSAPTVRLTEEQKQRLAELESKYAARIAEREITLQGEAAQARGRGDWEEAQKVEQRLVEERKALQAELEARKEQVRQGKG